MSHFKTKSIENIQAADLLIEKDLFASSIHCAYYSCFQLTKYTLKTPYNIPYDDQEIKGSDSHNYVMNLMCNKLRAKNIFYSVDYKSWMNKLKKERKKSDYLNTIIIKEDAIFALDLAKKINELLTIQQE